MAAIGDTIGNIRIEGVIGEGGMGSVFLGFDEVLKRKVAVKCIKGQRRFEGESKMRFLREAQVLSQLEHPNICRIYDYVEGAEEDFLILEFLRGVDLKEAQKQGLGYERKLAVALEIADVLVVAHEKGVIHRDLKPENIMMLSEGTIKVLDFGLSRPIMQAPEVSGPLLPPEIKPMPEDAGDETQTIVLTNPVNAALANRSGSVTNPGNGTDSSTTQVEVSGGDMTTVGSIMGTPKYMSPEQGRGETLYGASDMYTFGLILQWLFTEQSPYPKDLGRMQICLWAARAKSLPVEGLSKPLTLLINQLKDATPEQRPTAAETRNRLLEIQDAPKRRLRKLSLAAAMAALVFFSILSTIGFFRAGSAQKKAEASARIAQEESRTARQTIDLLSEFLSSVDPREKGRDLKVIELLEAFEPRLEELSAKPVLQAALLKVYGTTYKGLGLHERSLAYIDQALELQTQEKGADHPDTLDLYSERILTLIFLGRHETAEQEARDTLERAVQVLGPHHDVTLDLSEALGLAFFERDQFEDARRVYQDVFTYVRENLSPDHKNYSTSQNGLGIALLRLNRFAEAEVHLTEALAHTRKMKGPTHPETLTAINNLAVNVGALGQLRKALPLFAELAEKMSEVMGAAHPLALGSLNNYGYMLVQMGRYEQSLEVLAQGLALYETSIGPDHEDTLMIKRQMIPPLTHLGRTDEAEALAQDLLKAFAEKFGPDHPRTLALLTMQINILERTGRFAEMEAAARGLWPRYQKVMGEKHLQSLNAQHQLAVALHGQGRYEEALGLASEALAQLTASVGERNSTTLRVRHHLANLLQTQERYGEAEAHLHAVLSLREAGIGSEHPATGKAAQDLIAVRTLLQLPTADLEARYPQTEAPR